MTTAHPETSARSLSINSLCTMTRISPVGSHMTPAPSPLDVAPSSRKMPAAQGRRPERHPPRRTHPTLCRHSATLGSNRSTSSASKARRQGAERKSDSSSSSRSCRCAFQSHPRCAPPRASNGRARRRRRSTVIPRRSRARVRRKRVRGTGNRAHSASKSDEEAWCGVKSRDEDETHIARTRRGRRDDVVSNE